MSSSSLQILYIADIVGRVGFEITSAHLEEFKEKYDVSLTIANGENSASGKGMTRQISQSFFNIGINVITSGNHIWDKKQFYPVLEENPRILRPLNYPPGTPGFGSYISEDVENVKIGVINLQGRSFMYPIDCPFRRADEEIVRLKNKGVDVIIVDFHAEATAEKIAMGWYLDGKVSAVIGSHTHVQTADERVLPGGTAYITDAGMTGPFDSVIGMEKETAIQRFLTQLPVHYKMAQEDSRFSGVVISIDSKTGKARSISRFRVS